VNLTTTCTPVAQRQPLAKILPILHQQTRFSTSLTGQHFVNFARSIFGIFSCEFSY